MKIHPAVVFCCAALGPFSALCADPPSSPHPFDPLGRETEQNMPTNTSFGLPVGVFQLVSVFVPPDTKGNPDPSRKWLFFVKAEARTPPASEN